MAHRSKEKLAEIYDNSEHKVIKGFRKTMNFILGRNVSSETENLAFSKNQLKQRANNAVFRKHALESMNPDPDIELGPAVKFLDRMRAEHGRGVWPEKVEQSGKDMVVLMAVEMAEMIGRHQRWYR